LPDLSTGLLPAQSDNVLELDELWSFVAKRKNKQWVWLALCRRTRQIVAYAIGTRGIATCRRLWHRIPAAYRSGLMFTDFWEAYRKVIPAEQHRPSGKETGQTSHIERWNNTVRQRLARFVRRTRSFSKSLRMHALCLRLFIHEYNRCCTMRCTNRY
jgi:insertion element IS1 protein InsB